MKRFFLNVTDFEGSKAWINIDHIRYMKEASPIIAKSGDSDYNTVIHTGRDTLFVKDKFEDLKKGILQAGGNG